MNVQVRNKFLLVGVELPACTVGGDAVYIRLGMITGNTLVPYLFGPFFDLVVLDTQASLPVVVTGAPPYGLNSISLNPIAVRTLPVAATRPVAKCFAECPAERLVHASEPLVELLAGLGFHR